MKCRHAAIAAIIAALALVGCDTGVRDVDLTPQRNFSADIDASLNHGPTASKPGMVSNGEPIGALPWEIGQSRQ